ncbi:MAG: hypothetical protein AB1325_10845 [Nitrospirota bacterium]
MFIGRLNKVFALLIAGMFLFLSPALSYGFDGLGLNPKTAEKVSDSAMDEMRGKYYGFYFSINFTGYWDTLGSIPTAKITYNAGLGRSNTSGSVNIVGTQDNISLSTSSVPDNSSTNNSSSNSDSVISSSSSSGTSDSSSSSNEPAVKTTAVIGGSGLNGSGGVMQLTQVPGSQNFVYSGIVINLSIFNIKDAADSSLRSVLSSITGL